MGLQDCEQGLSFRVAPAFRSTAIWLTTIMNCIACLRVGRHKKFIIAAKIFTKGVEENSPSEMPTIPFWRPDGLRTKTQRVAITKKLGSGCTVPPFPNHLICLRHL